MAEAASLSVRGSATLEVQPDFSVISIEIGMRDPDRQTALSSVRDTLQSVRAGLEGAAGVRESEFAHTQVHEIWDASTGSNTAMGWNASVTGHAYADIDATGSVLAVLTGAGAQVRWVDWRLERDNPGEREVRRLAVADAARAAQDFADALGRSVGDLLALADPGLLGPQNVGTMRSHAARGHPGVAQANPPEPQLDLNPRPVVLYASVEARYSLAD